MIKRIAIIGRSELLYNTASRLIEKGYEIPLIITAKEAPEYKYTSADFEKLANRVGAEFIHTAKINDETILNRIKNIDKIDIGVSINYSGVIAEEVIDLFPYGILNAHGGDLPRYRGNACMAWAIIAGEEKVGLCIHTMIGGELDSGNIIVRKFLPLNMNTKVGETFKWMEDEIPPMMEEAISLLSNNKDYVLAVQSKNPEDALRCYPRNAEDGKIKWHETNENIIRLINASSLPFVGAYCYYEEQKIVVWDAELFNDQERYLAVPGQISSIDKNHGTITVICGKGKIKINVIGINDHQIHPAEFFQSTRKRLK